MAADGSAANRLAQAGKLIAGGLIAAVLAAVRARHVLRGDAQAQHARPRRLGFGT